MGFCQQIRLIAWKNFTLRRRQKIRCIVELVWPLVLFLILMWVRTRELKEYFPECHFAEKAMPSSGQFQFLHDFICAFNNTCHSSDQNSRETFVSNTTKTLLLSMMNVLANKSVTEELMSLEGIVDDIEDLTALLRNITTDERKLHGYINIGNLTFGKNHFKQSLKDEGLFINDDVVDMILDSNVVVNKLSLEHLDMLKKEPHKLLCNKTVLSDVLITADPQGIDSIIKSFCNEDTKRLSHVVSVAQQEQSVLATFNQVLNFIEINLGRNLMWSEWEKLNSIIQDIAEKIIQMDSYQNIFGNFTEVVKNVENTSNVLQEYNITSTYANFLILQHLFCGSPVEKLLEAVKYQERTSDRIDKLQQKFGGLKYSFETSISDPDASPKCNKMFENMGRSPVTRLVWRQMKPLFLGKILFSPQVPVIQRVMMKVNQSFESILFWREVLHLWMNRTVPFIKKNFANVTKNMHYIKEFTNSEIGYQLVQQIANNLFAKNNFKSYDKHGNKVSLLIKRLLDENLISLMENFLNMIDEILPNLTTFLECFDVNKTEGFDSEEVAEIRGMQLIHKQKLWALVSFTNVDSTSSLPPFVKYKIRMDANRVDSTYHIRDRLRSVGPRSNPNIDLKYISYGFAYLQDIIEHSIITEQTGFTNLPGIILQQFPYPCHVKDRFVLAISRQLPMFMTLSWVYSCAMIAKSIVFEKECRLKETMKMMGLGNRIHWVGWFIDSIGPMLLTVVLLSLILVYGRILENSDLSIVFLFLLFNCIATVCMSFLISTFFSKANLAAAAGGIIFFMLYLPYPTMIIWEHKISAEAKILASLLSNVAFGFGCSYFAQYEEIGIGINWNNIGSSPLLYDKYNLQSVMYMLVIDSVVYIILAWYIEEVHPGMYGVPKPWYFPFTKFYWCGTAIVESEGSNDMELRKPHSYENTEEEPAHLILGVSICNLTKIYNNGKVALQDLNINFYESQITSFLGHNGAGKTTTISILTGLFPPTSGTARIYDLDIRTHMDSIRKSLGMCPQHNVLFDKLTVEDHLWFFAQLKEYPKQKTILEIEDMLNDLGLHDKRKNLASELSGGMKRKLSIAAAFIGGSRTVILDEPTAGIDPYSRRSIWEVLIKYKKGRTIILTTHFMDEADLLGDRIAILSHGRLQCCGSSLFLRSKFGRGYYLTIETKNQHREEHENVVEADTSSFNEKVIGSSVDESPIRRSAHPHTVISEVIRKKVESSQVLQSLGSRLVILLPQRQDVHKFGELFKLLDELKEELDITTYGITDTSLEEIFLNICANDEKEITNPSSSFIIEDDIPKRKRHSSGNNTLETSDREQRSHRGKHFRALHIKHFHHTKRNIKGLFCELIFPAFFVLVSLVFTSTLPNITQRPPLILDPALYGSPNFILFSNENPSDLMANKIEKEIFGPIGLGTICIMKDMNSTKYCTSDGVNRSFTKFIWAPPENVTCSCSYGAMHCITGDSWHKLPISKVATGDIMVNMTGHNISDWLIKTTKEYETYRYGGYTIGIQNSFMDVVDNFTHLLEVIVKNNVTLENENLSKEESRKIQKNIKVWFNNKGWISSVAYMNAINNVILRSLLPLNKTATKNQYGIQVINHPMNLTFDQMTKELDVQSSLGLIRAISVIFALSFVPASFVVFIVEERVNKFKHLQLVSGVNRLIYWLSAFSWDMMSYMVSAVFCFLIFLAFQEEAYILNSDATLLLLFLYGWASIPLVYPASFIFSISSTAFVTLGCLNLFLGVITTIATFMLELMDDEELQYIGSITSKVFLIFPQFCLGEGLLNMVKTHLSRRMLLSYGVQAEINVYAWNVLGKNLFSLFVEGIFFFLMVLIIEYKFYKCFRFKCSKKLLKSRINGNMDEDVNEERNRIFQGDTQNDVLLLQNLTKVYNRKVVAVNNLSFGVQRGECFGLLGLNGAGKTTTFKILTGDIDLTSGEAFVCGISISKNLKEAQQHIGYCPQFDALDPLLTPREHLDFYNRLRGAPRALFNKAVHESLLNLGLLNYSECLTRPLSGGNKRKLSTAIALVGEPDIIFLDEPTTGMDVKARRFLWSYILSVIERGQSVILTSHSMEECEALCTRLAIMAKGEFKCLGTPQHLKNKYGQGYILLLRGDGESVSLIIEHVQKLLPQSELRDIHANQIKFQIPQDSVDLAYIFKNMEAGRVSGVIQDYSVSQTQLEEVFLRFAHESNEPMA